MKMGKINRTSRISRISKVTIGLFAVLVCMMAMDCRALAAGIKSFSVSMEVEQSSAREMLTMINDFRTGDDAWYYDENSNKVYIKNAGTLAYDYNLEQVAIQRAYETAVSFAHTRPNGQSCFTCKYDGTQSYGENIAAGYSTAESVFIGWREDNYGYSGQGHRRNMLKTGYTAIGIGHVVYNGVHYWVQEFGYSNSNAAYTDPINEKNRSVTVDIDTDTATFSLIPEKTSVYETYAGKGSMPAVGGYYKTADTWGSKGLKVPDSELPSVSWVTGDSAIVSVTGDGAYEAMGVGSTTLTGSGVYEDTTYSCTVNFTVSAKSITDSDISVSVPTADYAPNGATPTPVITFGSRQLEEGVDYTVAYTGNTYINAKAHAWITGMGNYRGYIDATFEIKPVDIDKCEFQNLEDMVYTGQYLKPDSIVGTLNGQDLLINKHFIIDSYRNNLDAGTATVVIRGYNGVAGGSDVLTGKKELEFKITPKPISDLVIAEIPEQIYTGSPIVPSVSLVGYDQLKPGEDYTVDCTNNTEVGTANVTVTGIGNYTGTTESTFQIKKQRVYIQFTDVKEGQWFVNALQFVYDNDIMAGTGAEFKPNSALTREQFTQVLYNHKGKPEVTVENLYTDVKNEWYKNSVLWAKENDIANGKGAGVFGVGANITREELALMLYKYAKLCGYDTTAKEAAIEPYGDAQWVSSWAKNAMNWAVTKGIMSGKGEGNDLSVYRLDPQGNATRAECASMMKKLLTMGE